VDSEKINHFDLVMLKQNEKLHYTYISNFWALISSQKFLRENYSYFCKQCFTTFENRPNKLSRNESEALEKHMSICGTYKSIRLIMPKENTMLKFEAWQST